ncbi:tautomerase family protein [Alkalimarinus coralli]|uniref:tautomerase family protein n=1 Tax=Alkalimarinus coralli TaxID=2935863 RepID=UPI00202B6B6F|nr:hypothetical protein [Alkalimarinus coralli]
MPIQITMTEGLVSHEAAKKMHQEVGQAFLDNHQISDNRFMLPNVIGEVVFIDKGLTFAGLQVSTLAIVELKVPSFTFGTQAQKDKFVKDVTDIVLTYTDGKLPKESIWVSAVYAVDGLWGIAGKAYKNEQLGESIQLAS